MARPKNQDTFEYDNPDMTFADDLALYMEDEELAERELANQNYLLRAYTGMDMVAMTLSCKGHKQFDKFIELDNKVLRPPFTRDDLNELLSMAAEALGSEKAAQDMLTKMRGYRVCDYGDKAAAYQAEFYDA